AAVIEVEAPAVAERRQQGRPVVTAEPVVAVPGDGVDDSARVDHADAGAIAHVDVAAGVDCDGLNGLQRGGECRTAVARKSGDARTRYGADRPGSAVHLAHPVAVLIRDVQIRR